MVSSFSVLSRSLVLAVGLCILMHGTASGQGNVCIVDVATIFKNHTSFNASLEALKQEADRYKLHLDREGQKLKAKSEQLSNYNPGSPEYQRIESELAQESANLEVQRRAKTRELVQKEAKLHFDTYVQVTQIIAQYCETNAFRLALRFDSTQINPDDPQTIMQRVNDNVVYYKPQRDITPTIIRLVNESATATQPSVGSLPNGQNR